MKSNRKELWFNIPNRRAFVNITPQVEQCLRESRIKEGLALIKIKHTKFIQESPLKLEEKSAISLSLPPA
jgi:thiamine phosphate synthase YjbQ (UPF0047 family)